MLMNHETRYVREHLRWKTEMDQRQIELTREPSRGFWQRTKVELLELLPLDREL